MPALALRLVKMHRVDKWLHAFCVQTVWLRKVDNIDSNPSIGLDVHHCEVVPLVGSAVRLCVILQVKVVFAIRTNCFLFVLCFLLEFLSELITHGLCFCFFLDLLNRQVFFFMGVYLVFIEKFHSFFVIVRCKVSEQIVQLILNILVVKTLVLHVLLFDELFLPSDCFGI